MIKAFLLRGTGFSVDYDLPKEINQARKSLWNELKSIKSKSLRANVQSIHPAKLVVDGRVVCDKLPHWSDALRRNRLGDFTHVDDSVFFERPGVNMSTQPSTVFDLGRDRQGSDAWKNDSMSICSDQGSVCDMPVNVATRSSERPNANSDQAGTIDSEQESLTVHADTQPPPLESTSAQQALNINDIFEGGVDKLPPLPPSPENPKANQIVSETVDLHSSSSQNNISELFRPYNILNKSTNSTENINKQTRSKSENPERGHVSRAMERGIRRRPSLSVDRRSATSGTSNTGKPNCDKNRPTGDKIV